MMFNKKEAEKHIQWRLHSGNCSFWWDNWLGTGALAQHRTEGGRPRNITVSQFWESGHWNLQKLNHAAPVHKIASILHTPIYHDPNTLDQDIWVPNDNGNFTCSSAWEVIRKKRPVSFTNKMIWHKMIPFKWSFCLWRAVRNKLPTDDRVLLFSNPIVSICVCCQRYGAETVEHIFSTGHFAVIVWRTFGGAVGIQTAGLPHRLLLMKCAKYGTKQSSLTRVLFAINSDIHLLLKTNYPSVKWPLQWTDLYQAIEDISYYTNVQQVTWRKPAQEFVKINSDGSALTNPGKIGVEAIIRDHRGTFIHALAGPMGKGTNNQAEIKVAIIGITWCLDNGYTKVHLESDSALLIH
uniref:RNase H type-1 domain-containing protein n=1 Tax=Nicotiana tabacum TaxID=4097 RepID=A0A1S4AZQ9_TOBAC|nr:PREDICTED: uncharacterized protein LOC107802997 [Nicotiana tabacum]